MSFLISKIALDEDANKVLKIKQLFFRTNPLVTIFDLHNAFSDDDIIMPPSEHSSPHDFYIKAEDPEGCIIGLAINKFYIPTNNNFCEEDDVILNFIRFSEVDAKLYELPEKTMELCILIVQEEWRRMGVAKKLVEESMRASREGGFQAMRVCCTSEFSARIVRSLGWKEHYRLAYQDYPSRSGQNVKINSNPPHNHVYYYWIEL